MPAADSSSHPTRPASRAAAEPPVHRFEVGVRPGTVDPIARSVERDAQSLGVSLHSARTAHVYLVQGAFSSAQLESVASRLLADPVVEVAAIGAAPPEPDAQVVEVHPLPGVMDPVAQSVELAIRELTGVAARVTTGWRYDLRGTTPQNADLLARRLLSNPVIHRVERAPWRPTEFPRARSHEHATQSVPILSLQDPELEKLSRETHLFLSLDEMKAIQAEYRRLGRDPREIELETLAQTWSEHCVHKTLKSTINYKAHGAGQQTSHDPINWNNRPGHALNPDGSVTIHNLLKSTVAAATFELIKDGIDWTLSVFKDNSGVIALDDHWGVCIKVETHNHPSAIEPYGGAATGAGGCIRDVIGTGLGARPIANTDVFCVAFPDLPPERVPPGCLHPRRVLTQVVAGVRDYGNRMGIPTVNGAVAFDHRYIGNPLVYCGCIGLIPRHLVKGQAQPGDRIIALGGRTGRDGIHGATFSSAELTDTHADEFAHAVQIGNAITEKQLLDAIMRARDAGPRPLYTAMTDCGAGGFSSAVGEMGSQLGAEVHLDRAPLKYPGLSCTEVWISEAQERMVLAVPVENLPALQRICDEEGVEMADLGRFGTPQRDLILHHQGAEVGRLSMHFLHDGIPMPTREAVWQPPLNAVNRQRNHEIAGGSATAALSHAAMLSRLLRHPNIASKHWIIRQYDHEVRGQTVVKPLVGPRGFGPSDAAVLEPIAGSNRGIAIACGLQTGLGDPMIGGDPYLMTLAAIDECVRNLVCTGADPSRIAILDNFCWPSCKDPANLASLVRAAEGCYDGAKAFRTPFVSGKDSLNNQFTTDDGRTIQIPPTLLITGLGIVPRIDLCVTSDAKEPGNILLLVGETGPELGGSHWQQLTLGAESSTSPGTAEPDYSVPATDLAAGPRNARAVAVLIARGLVRAAHDCSDGGLAVAVAEMLIAGSTPDRPIGAEINLGSIPFRGQGTCSQVAALFAETPSRYLLEIRPQDLSAAESLLASVPHATIGRLNDSGRLDAPLADIRAGVDELTAAWRATLDW
ncbi:MAG: AIR synthase-related protein [Phycisphaerales bacterium]